MEKKIKKCGGGVLEKIKIYVQGVDEQNKICRGGGRQRNKNM